MAIENIEENIGQIIELYNNEVLALDELKKDFCKTDEEIFDERQIIFNKIKTLSSLISVNGMKNTASVISIEDKPINQQKGKVVSIVAYLGEQLSNICVARVLDELKKINPGYPYITVKKMKKDKYSIKAHCGERNINTEVGRIVFSKNEFYLSSSVFPQSEKDKDEFIEMMKEKKEKEEKRLEKFKKEREELAKSPLLWIAKDRSSVITKMNSMKTVLKDKESFFERIDNSLLELERKTEAYEKEIKDREKSNEKNEIRREVMKDAEEVLVPLLVSLGFKEGNLLNGYYD